MRIFDCSDPSNLEFVGRYINKSLNYPSVKSVAISGSYAYVISGLYAAIEIDDVSDPTNPTGVGWNLGNILFQFMGCLGVFSIFSIVLLFDNAINDL